MTRNNQTQRDVSSGRDEHSAWRNMLCQLFATKGNKSCDCASWASMSSNFFHSGCCYTCLVLIVGLVVYQVGSGYGSMLFTRMFIKLSLYTHAVCTSKLNKKPTMPELRHLQLPNDEAIDIAERIGTSYQKFGSLLLDDSYGTQLPIITHDNRDKVVAVNVEILMKWLKGSGRRPVTWTTLLETLRAIGEHELVKDISDALRMM